MTIFLLKLSICWSFFALLYTLLLRHETFFRANRLYLLGSLLLGIALALCPGEQIPVPSDQSGAPIVALPEITVGLQQAQELTNTWQNLGLLWMVYIAGAILTATRFFWGLLKIVQMAIRGKSERLSDGCLLIETSEAKVPFSFFKWVFVSSEGVFASSKDKFNKSDYELMLAHERAHAHDWHSADVLLAEVLCVVFWFHPLAHWYRRALRVVHEYLADAAASRLADRKQYGLLLIGQSQSGMPIVFANHFFQSPLKQRLVMLTKKSSAPIRALKFGLAGPLTLLFAMLFRQAPAIAQVVDQKHLEFVHNLEKSNWILVDTIITFNPETYEEKMQVVSNSIAPAVDESGKLLYRYSEIQPQFPGGQEALTKFMTDNLRYPEAAAGREGTIYVRFVVDDDGTIQNVGASRWHVEENNVLLDEGIRVVKLMPKWTPAQHKGKKVRCIMDLPIEFVSPKSKNKPVVVQPEFVGGEEAMIKFISSNMKYPEEAHKAKAEGTAYVEFAVKDNGSIEGANVLNAARLHPALVAEALRLVNSMPKWKPGMENGKMVCIKYTLPLKFKLN